MRTLVNLAVQMKKSFLFLSTSMFILLIGSNVYPQSHKMYLPAPAQATYINQIIMGDTLKNGNRVDNERVYVLQRGGVWFFNGVITNTGWDIRIKAEDGPGPKPVIYSSVAAGDYKVPADFIISRGNVYLKNIVVNGIYDLDPNYAAFTYGAPKELVVCTAAGNYSMAVDSCILLSAYQADLRTFAAIRSIRVTNTIFANSGCAPWQGVGDGRAVDARNVSIDTLYMVNNSFVNGQDRIFRHVASIGRIQNFVFDHNTIINNGGTYGVLALGLVGNKVEIKNNLFVDPMVAASDTVYQRHFDFIEDGETFSPTIRDKVKQPWIYSQKENTPYTTIFDIKNNYWYETPQIREVWRQMKSLYYPLLRPAPHLTDFIASQLSDSSSAFIKLDTISFANVPKPMAGYATWYFTPRPEGAGEYNSGNNYEPFDKRTGIYHRDTMNCAYPTGSPAFTGGTDVFPAGDLNWFPDKKAEWLHTTAVNKYDENIPFEYSLDQNFPNPFNPATNIRYSIFKSSRVTLSVYDILGRKVKTLVNENQPPGRYTVSFDGSNLASGIYLYRLEAGTFSSTKKLILLK